MQQRSIKLLEFDKIRERLSGYTQSPMGRQACMSLLPLTEANGVQRLLSETLQAEGIIHKLGYNPIQSVEDIRELLVRLRVGSIASMREMLEIGAHLKATAATRRALLDTASRQSTLWCWAEALHIDDFLQQDIQSIILSEDEMADDASDELYSIRRQLLKTSSRMRDKLNEMVRSSNYQKMLQEPIVTRRADRFVLPVKQEYRTQIPGLLHDQSASGQTVFIEPSAVVEMGNEIRVLKAREAQEMERILMDLSVRVMAISDYLQSNHRYLMDLDVCFAKAALAIDMKAVCPEILDKPSLSIKRARHPLIDAQKVVPVDLWVGQGFKSLVITGPNTGGKTVTLKTAGLFVLMAQSGIFIPCEPGSGIGIFQSVCADIGDEQSIEQSLSTFSSHMTHIVEILASCDENTLVILDELGAGTDPDEGAALAMAILEELYKRDCITLSSTHYSELKAFAMTHQGFQNACMEFDIQTLAPTYHLYIGIPGQSNAFEIARKLGLNAGMIASARKYLSREAVDFENAISTAQQHSRTAMELVQQREQVVREQSELAEQLRQEVERIEQQKQKIIEKARMQAKEIVMDARAQMESAIAEVKQSVREQESERTRAIQHARSQVQQVLEQVQEEPARTEAGGQVDCLPEIPYDLAAGERVILLPYRHEATVLKAPNDKQEVAIQVGVIKMTVKLNELRRVNPAAQKPQEQTPRGHVPDFKLTPISQELDVRGQTLDEALLLLDDYIDSISRAKLNEARIIHGKGTGVLRNGIQAHLRRHPQVAAFRMGQYGEGETGVTIITLK